MFKYQIGGGEDDEIEEDPQDLKRRLKRMAQRRDRSIRGLTFQAVLEFLSREEGGDT